MASLRARLLVAVLVLTAVGLLLVGAIVYAEQRSFLVQRVDQQLRSAPGPLAVALNEDRGFGRVAPAHAPPAGPPAADGTLPSGPAGGERPAGGKVVGSPIVFRYGQNVTADPDLPAKISVGKPFTVHGKGGDEKTYRVLAAREPRDTTLTVVAIPMGDVEQTLHRLLAVLALVIGGVLLVLGFAAWGVVRVGLLPLDRIGHTAGAIAGGDLSHRVASTDPRTEVGRLGIALNAMLDRLESAFAARKASENRLRQFLADASHELRTPLASIRGYAELFRMGAARDPQDVAKAMRRIEEEAARMGVLVEDLLMLARLDEVADAPHTEVDLGRLVADAADDARATDPDREISSRVDAEPPGPATPP